jgi:hypothetical protein
MINRKIVCFLVVYCALFVVFLAVSLESDNFFRPFVRKSQNGTCGRYPSDEDVTIDNLYWQVLEVQKGFINILNAYLDTRENKSVVRINVNSVPLEKSDEFYCQFWSDDTSSAGTVKATEVLLMWGEIQTFIEPSS